MSQTTNAQQGSTDWSELQSSLPLLQEAYTDSSVPQRYQGVIRQACRFVTENISQISQLQGMARTASAGSGQQNVGDNSNISGSLTGSTQKNGQTGC